MATKSRIFIEQRREIEKVLLGGEDCIRSKFYDLYADINRYGRLVADQTRNINDLVEAAKDVRNYLELVKPPTNEPERAVTYNHFLGLLKAAIAAVEETP